MTYLRIEDLPPHLQAQARRQLDARKPPEARGEDEGPSAPGRPSARPTGWSITIPGLRLGRGNNDRGHWSVHAREAKAIRQAVQQALPPMSVGSLVLRPSLPLTVTMTRVSPSARGLDDDNLAGACKPVRDQIADWLGVDDSDERVAWVPAQDRGPWAVRVEVTA